MDLSVHTVGTYTPQDNSWLDSAEETDTGVPVTLDVSKFDASQYANGFIPSGCVVGLVGGVDPGVDVGGPYDDDATDGREVASGVLFGDVKVRAGATKVFGTLLRSGRIRPNRLPFQAGQTGGGFLDAAAKTDLGSSFKYRTV
jgi:hypothetical protein